MSPDVIPVPVRVLVTLMVVALVVMLSVTPGRSESGDTVFSWVVAQTPSTIQKMMHIVAYAVVAWLLAWSLAWLDSAASRIILALIFAVVLGATLEWYQTMVPGRFGSYSDILRNALGAIIGVAGHYLLEFE